VRLADRNELAWQLYWNARLPGDIGPVLRELRTLRLTEFEADELAIKIEFLAGVVAEIEAERAKRERESLRSP